MGLHAYRADSRRILAALRAILPPSASVTIVGTLDDGSTELSVGPRTVRAKWLGNAWLGQVRGVLESPTLPDIVVARRMSPGGREALAKARVSWVDETGEAEVALDSIIVSRSGRQPQREPTPPRWTPAVVAVAEALLCGVGATVTASSAATGLSSGACTAALKTLTDFKLLSARTARGRGSGRTVVDSQNLLEAYATAASSLAPTLSVAVGVTWRDPLDGLADLGRSWTATGIPWAATGMVAAAVLAPLLTGVGTAEVYVGARTIADLDGLARRSGLRPLPGGRLTLRPFPTAATEKLATIQDGVAVAPWPRVFVDLRRTGVRGEEAAEHLREVMNARRTRANEGGPARG